MEILAHFYRVLFFRLFIFLLFASLRVRYVGCTLRFTVLLCVVVASTAELMVDIKEIAVIAVSEKAINTSLVLHSYSVNC